MRPVKSPNSLGLFQTHNGKTAREEPNEERVNWVAMPKTLVAILLSLSTPQTANAAWATGKQSQRIGVIQDFSAGELEKRGQSLHGAVRARYEHLVESKKGVSNQKFDDVVSNHILKGMRFHDVENLLRAAGSSALRALNTRERGAEIVVYESRLDLAGSLFGSVEAVVQIHFVGTSAEDAVVVSSGGFMFAPSL